MQTIQSIVELRKQITAWRLQQKRIALVPTMGNLHAGHLSLVEQAGHLADQVVVSIFVNPMQFGEGEDFNRYPRTLANDAAVLQTARAELLFMPEVDAIYPHGLENMSYVEVPGITEGLCGAFRPGHFRGVATVVAKLFNMVQPDLALFGEKDYQQLQVIRQMVADLSFPIEVIAVPTVRETDGLAMSSRNGFLSAEEREIAPQLYQALKETALRLKQGEREFSVLEEDGARNLKNAGFDPEYYAIRQAQSLESPTADSLEVVVLAAARLGSTRLIDNLCQSLPN